MAATRVFIARYIGSLQGGDVNERQVADDAEGGLQKAGLVIDPNASRGVTVFGESLLLDGDYHFEDSLDSEYQYRDYEAARRRIEIFAGEYLGGERLSERIVRIVQTLQGRLDQGAETLRERRHYITCWTERLGAIRRKAADKLEESRLAVARLETDQERLVQTHSEHPVEAAEPGGRKGLAGRLFRKISRRVREAATAIGHSDDLLRRVEHELLRARLSEELLKAEIGTIDETLRELEEENARARQCAELLADEAGKLRIEAEKAESSRGWNPASGEMWLNGPALTRAAIESLGYDGLRAQMAERYLKKYGHPIFVETNGIIRSDDVTELSQIAEELIRDRLDWSAPDCVVALANEEENFPQTLREAVRQFAARKHLAPDYTSYLARNTFASIAYQQSRRPHTNQSFARLLDDFQRVMEAEVNIISDDSDPETITCFIEDRAIPASALSFCDQRLYDAYDVGKNPSFTPHPDLYAPAEAQPHHAGRTVREVAGMIRLVVNHPVRQIERREPNPESLAVNDDLGGYNPIRSRLGAYLPDERVIEIYTANIERMAQTLRVSSQALRRVVEAHEAAHAVIHLGQDEEENPPVSALREGAVIEDELQETLAQLVCRHFLATDSEGLDCFEQLNAYQPERYRQWRRFQRINLGTLRQFILRSRAGLITSITEALSSESGLAGGAEPPPSPH